MVADQKRKLRRVMRARRRALPEHQRRTWDRQIAFHLMASQAWAQAHVLLAYHAMPDEVGTSAIVEAALQQNKTLLLPRCQAGGRHFEPVPVQDLTQELIPGPFPDLWEPAPELVAFPDDRIIDLVLVPGLAFDAHGGRLGFGAGMYDRFLAGATIGHSVALAYGAQIVPRVPVDHRDRAPDRVLCENGWL